MHLTSPETPEVNNNNTYNEYKMFLVDSKPALKISARTGAIEEDTKFALDSIPVANIEATTVAIEYENEFMVSPKLALSPLEIK